MPPSAMINSGALPKVAFSNPPTASPVRVAICSVACTIMLAIGMMASAAEKNSTGRRHVADVLENDCDRDENKQPVQ